MLESIVTVMENAIEDVLPGKVESGFSLHRHALDLHSRGEPDRTHSGPEFSDIGYFGDCESGLLVFLSVHWFGIRAEGWKAYLKHYAQPNPIILPFHLISEVSRTLALAVRLFGNMMSLEIAAVLVLMVAGFLVPVPDPHAPHRGGGHSSLSLWNAGVDLYRRWNSIAGTAESKK